LVFSLDPSAELAKARNNFLALCKGDKGACKNAPNKRLHYLRSPIHRIVRGYVAQGGDITRGDGSGGEVCIPVLLYFIYFISFNPLPIIIIIKSIYGGKFKDEKEGLKKDVRRGSLAMANSGKNSNSSQYFVVLANDATSWAKVKGKYVVFGEVKEGEEVLDKLDAVGTENGVPGQKVWVGDCGVLE